MKLKIRRGATLLDPFPVGIRANGDIATMIVVRKEGGVHSMISGQTGAGKSYGEIPVLLTAGALQADQILMDPVKGIQSYQSIAGCLQMYEISPQRCKKLIKQLLNVTLPARTNYLASEGLQQWEPRSKLRFLRIHIEESWKLADANELVGLAVALRSAGGQLTLSLQQPTWDQIPTVVRNQIGSFRCYGLSDDDYAIYSLPEDVVSAGARPGQWGNEDPGMHYLVGPKMTMKEKTMPVRAFSDGTGENTFAAAAAYVAANLGPMCPVTAASLGDLWDTRIAPLDLVKQNGLIVPGPVTQAALSPAPAVPAVGTGDTDGDNPDGDTDPWDSFDPDDPDYLAALDELYDDDPELEDVQVTDDGDQITFTAGDGDEFTIELENPDDLDDRDGPVPDPDEPTHPTIARLIGDPPKNGLSPQEFKLLLEELVTEFLASGRPSLQRNELINIAADSGWSPASFYKYLGRDPRIEKADRGWVPATKDVAA
jgi:hypothetical protein